MRRTIELLSASRESAKARKRRTEYLTRAYACRDMAVRALDARDAQFLCAMALVWQLLADRCTSAHNAAPEVPP
jgi:hypothetical protein